MITKEVLQDYAENGNKDVFVISSDIDNRIYTDVEEQSRKGFTNSYVRVYREKNDDLFEIIKQLEERGFVVYSYQKDYVLTTDVEFCWD